MKSRKSSGLLFVLVSLLLILITITSVTGEQGADCEWQAKAYQASHGGHLILIIPFNSDGSYETGGYAGHWMNKAWNKNDGIYYYDPSERTYYYQGDAKLLQSDFERQWNKKVRVLDYNNGEIPFGIIWHY